MRDSDVLDAAADVVVNGWTTDSYAKNKDGKPVHVMHEDAVCFCTVGAVARVLGGSVKAADAVLERWLVPELEKVRRQRTSARSWNDDHNNPGNVASCLQRAATRAKTEETKTP